MFNKAYFLLALLAAPAFAETLTITDESGRPTLPDVPSFGTVWNECDGDLTGNYVNLPCSQRRGMANEFAKYLKDNIFKCVNTGLFVLGSGSKAKAVHLVHDGTLADENHNRASLHAAGRAIDVLVMKVTREDGSKIDYDFRVTTSKPLGKERRFYEGFRACWGKLQDERECPKRTDGFPTGTIGWEDPRHVGHHLHTSMPFCPDSDGHFITEFGY